jgi:hypothetical protein
VRTLTENTCISQVNSGFYKQAYLASVCQARAVSGRNSKDFWGLADEFLVQADRASLRGHASAVFLGAGHRGESMVPTVSNSADQAVREPWFLNRNGVGNGNSASTSNPPSNRNGDTYTPSSDQTGSTDSGITFAQIQFLSFTATFVLGQTDSQGEPSTTSTGSDGGSTSGSASSTDGSSAASSSGSTSGSSSTTGSSSPDSSGSSSLQTLNNALGVLGFNQQQIETFDQLIQLINGVSPTASNDVVTQIESLAQQAGQAGATQSGSSSNTSGDNSGSSASSSADATGGAAGNAGSGSIGTTASSSTVATQAANGTLEQNFNNALATLGLNQQEIRGFDQIVPLIHAADPAAALNLVQGIESLAQQVSQSGNSSSSGASSSTNPASSGASGSTDPTSSTDGSSSSTSGQFEEISIQFEEVQIQGTFGGSNSSQQAGSGSGASNQSSNASGSSFDFVAFQLQIQEIAASLQDGSSASSSGSGQSASGSQGTTAA